jgi:hypothetical protein
MKLCVYSRHILEPSGLNCALWTVRLDLDVASQGWAITKSAKSIYGPWKAIQGLPYL